MLNQHKTIKWVIAEYNKPNPLADYLIPFIEGKKRVRIADIASGPFSTIGRHLEGVNIEIFASDKQDFTEFYKKYDVTPLYSIDYKDMEKLDYSDESFDILHCTNALDHTKDALSAILEMRRVCKTGGWVYINCNLDQLETGHKHYWSAKEDGTLENENSRIDLKHYGFNIKYVDKGGERRYNEIIATLKK